MKISDIYNKKYLIFIIITFIIILIAVFIVRPSIIGYSIYNEVKDSNQSLKLYKKNLVETNTELVDIQKNLSYCSDFNDKAFSQIDKITDKLIQCNKDLEKEKLQSIELVKEFEKNNDENDFDKENLIDDFENTISDLKREKNSIQNNYNELSVNSANNICCKMKIDNNKIDSYIVNENRIICSESSTLKISC